MAVAAFEHGPDCCCQRCVGFKPGNELGVRHGAHRGDAVLAAEPRTQELLDWIRDTQPIHAPCDAMTELRLAIVYRRVELATAAIDEADRLAEGRPVASYAIGKEWLPSLRADLDRWMSRATSLERELGRTPASRASLGLDLVAARKLGADLIEKYGGRTA